MIIIGRFMVSMPQLKNNLSVFFAQCLDANWIRPSRYFWTYIICQPVRSLLSNIFFYLMPDLNFTCKWNISHLYCRVLDVLQLFCQWTEVDFESPKSLYRLFFSFSAEQTDLLSGTKSGRLLIIRCNGLKEI